MKQKMRMPIMRRKAPGHPMDTTSAAASNPMTNPDMMEQERGLVPGKRMAPPRLGSLRRLKEMMQGHARRH